jgi:hypothetical protein
MLCGLRRKDEEPNRINPTAHHEDTKGTKVHEEKPNPDIAFFVLLRVLRVFVVSVSVFDFSYS